MKARVKATGKTIDVEKLADGVYVSTYDEDVYLEESLDFWGNAFSNFDYWTRLEHTYAGMAMNALLLTNNIRNGDLEGMRECNTNAMAIAHALVEKMKEEK